MLLVRVIAIVRGKVVSERSVYITRDIFQHSWISGDSIRTIYSRRRIKARCTNAERETCWNAARTLLHRALDIGYDVSKSSGSIKSWSLPCTRSRRE